LRRQRLRRRLAAGQILFLSHLATFRDVSGRNVAPAKVVPPAEHSPWHLGDAGLAERLA
jgi:hypothetical protein